MHVCYYALWLNESKTDCLLFPSGEYEDELLANTKKAFKKIKGNPEKYGQYHDYLTSHAEDLKSYEAVWNTMTRVKWYVLGTKDFIKRQEKYVNAQMWLAGFNPVYPWLPFNGATYDYSDKQVSLLLEELLNMGGGYNDRAMSPFLNRDNLEEIADVSCERINQFISYATETTGSPMLKEEDLVRVTLAMNRATWIEWAKTQMLVEGA